MLTPVNAFTPCMKDNMPLDSVRSGCGNIMPRNSSRIWAVVMNGTRCRILRGLATNSDDALTELVLRSEFRNLRDIMSDKPGRAFIPTGGARRSAMIYSSDPVAEDQRAFICQVIALLDSHRRAGEYDRLAVFAESDILGHLRLMLPGTLRDMVMREVARNLVQLPATDLQDAILQELNDDPSLF